MLVPYNSLNSSAAQIFTYRVPHSTIELRVACTMPVDSRDLGNTLLRIHEYIGENIQAYGDSWLWPKEDPFGWYKSGPDPQTGVNFTVQSVVSKHMTWGVLQIAVDGLYLSLPGQGRNFGAHFQIWDYEVHAEWGYGQVGVFRTLAEGKTFSPFHRVMILPQEGQR